jgi:hypothetical protein
MHTMPHLIKNSAGTWCVQKKVPEKLQAAVARVLGSKKQTQVYLKKSLGTKDRREATRRATHALADLDRTLREAEALSKQKLPERKAQQRATVNDAEVKRMGEYVYAKALAWDERTRYGRDEFKRIQAEHERLEGPLSAPWAFPYESLPLHGWSPAQLAEQRQQLNEDLSAMRESLALGDTSAVQDHVDDALSAFNIDLDRQSPAYPKLGMEILRAYVRALQAIEKRNAGEPIETPKLTVGATSALETGGTLRVAFEGWEKERERPTGSISEYRRAVELFIQLHGDLTVAAIKKSHARQYREALQDVPRKRTGSLLKASLPELIEWSRKHPDAAKVTQSTVNKQVGALQTIAEWAYANGVVPEDTPWSNPFAKMRVQGEQSERTSFESTELETLFAAPVFTKHEYPEGGRGPSAFWLPLLALFNGARQAELAGVTVADVRVEPETLTPLFYVTTQISRGKHLKTKGSQRVIPIHPQLVKLGFLRYVDNVRHQHGEQAFLFPLIAPKHKWDRTGVSAYSKWFGRYLRAQGVTDTAKVFHSFRHGFKDALRKTTPDEELRDALTGHRGPKSVGRGYGAKEMLARFGLTNLKSAVEKVEYVGLDLTGVQPFVVQTQAREVRKR